MNQECFPHSVSAALCMVADFCRGNSVCNLSFHANFTSRFNCCDMEGVVIVF